MDFKKINNYLENTSCKYNYKIIFDEKPYKSIPLVSYSVWIFELVWWAIFAWFFIYLVFFDKSITSKLSFQEKLLSQSAAIFFVFILFYVYKNNIKTHLSRESVVISDKKSKL